MSSETAEPRAWERPAAPEIDLAAVMATLWSRRGVILACVVASFAVAVLYLHIATYKYTIDLKITPAQGGGNESAGSRLGGLASLAGISLPKDQSVSPFQLYLESIQSEEVAARIAENPAIMRGMFATSWDAQKGRWREPQSALAPIKRAVKQTLGIPIYKWRAPGARDVLDYLQLNLTVVENPKKPVVVLRMQHPDPAFAVAVLNTLNRAANERVRERALVRSTANIAYLAQQLARVTLAEHREALAGALSDQEKQRMMANSGAPFAAEPVGEAVASSKPTKPQPVIVLVMSLFVGGLIGVAAAFALRRTGRSK